ncbi:hypothetical protein LTSEALA_1843 [Salmonella enterica subsp. enterica serovar Alachua str. R6-377]|uniref:Uncharacterized protein n=1 Tax=Salmonella enterica subsp. enterica serovar Alachua str. R6-377 TaxID=913241 RepID=G5LMQ8_SALET|nr:hypothetical protein LTSEALA_1843 [Salmonella enterica subsp. enterica serovar Alachua str. R6-377]
MSQSGSALRRNGFTFKQFFVAHDRCVNSFLSHTITRSVCDESGN